VLVSVRPLNLILAERERVRDGFRALIACGGITRDACSGSRRLPRCSVVTPRLGYVTVEGYEVFYGHVVEDIQAFQQGKPVRVINAATADRRR
jgi:hypothetical protein